MSFYDGNKFETLNTREKINHDDETAPLHHLSRPKGKYHSTNLVRIIQMIYLLSSIGWILLAAILGFFGAGSIGIILFVIPLIVYGIGFSQACFHTTELENDMFLGNFLSFAFLTASVLINWTKIETKRKYYKLLMVALILILLSLIDVWVKKKYQVIVKHVRSIFQTAALIVLGYVLYLYYCEIMENSNDKKKSE